MRYEIYTILSILNLLFVVHGNGMAQTISGRILDEKQQPIPYANVVLLLKSDSAFVAGTSTKSDGTFKVHAVKNPCMLRVSIIGYLTCFIDVKQEDMGDIIMQVDNKTLRTVVVTGSATTQLGNQSRIFINREMRRGNHTTAQMLGQMPNFYYDFLDNRLLYNNSSSIIVLVDSVEKNIDAVLNMQHIRFDRLDIINKPTGMYQGYEVLINFHTKPDYEGYEGSMFHNNGFIFNRYSDRNLLFDNDYGSLTYTKNKFTFYAWYNFSLTQNKHDKWYEQFYKLNGVTNKVVSNPDGTKNSATDYLYGNAMLSVSYAINKDKYISMAYNFNAYRDNSSSNTTINRSYDDGRNDISLRQNVDSKQRTGEHSLGIFYHDNSCRIKYSTDINYRFLPSNYRYQLGETTSFVLDNRFRDRMNFIRYRLSGWMRLAAENRLYLSAGYTATWKQYRRKDYDSGKELNSNSYLRNKLWSTASYTFPSNTQLSVTLWAELIHLKSGLQRNNQVPVGGDLMFYRKLKGYNWVRFNYSCNVQYPDQSISTEYGYFTDSLTWRGGNPWLHSNITHDFRIWFDAWQCFNVQAGHILSPNRFCTIADARQGALPSGKIGTYTCYIYQNTDYKEWWISTSFTKRFRTNFLFKADAKYIIARASYGGFTNSGHGLIASTSLNYYCPYLKTNINVQYRYTRNLVIYPQYRQVSNVEVPSFTFQRTFFKDRLDLQLSYSMMFHLFNADHITIMDSPVVYSTTLDRAFDRQKNNFVFSLRYRFAGGKSVRQYNHEMSKEK